MSTKGFFKGLSRSVSRLLTIALVLFGLAPTTAAHATSRSSVTDRVSRIRVTLREHLGNPVAMQESQGYTQLAQWGNLWTNWNNWNNWRDWNNWYNWGNWGNWGNGG